MVIMRVSYLIVSDDDGDDPWRGMNDDDQRQDRSRSHRRRRLHRCDSLAPKSFYSLS